MPKSKTDNYLNYTANFLLNGHIFEIRQQSKTMDQSYELFQLLKNDLILKFSLQNKLSLSIDEYRFYDFAAFLSDSREVDQKKLRLLGDNNLCFTYLDYSEASRPSNLVYWHSLKSLQYTPQGTDDTTFFHPSNPDILSFIRQEINADINNVKIKTKCYNGSTKPAQFSSDLALEDIRKNILYATIKTADHKLLATKFFSNYSEIFDANEENEDIDACLSYRHEDNAIKVASIVGGYQAQFSKPTNAAVTPENLCSKYIGAKGELKSICYSLEKRTTTSDGQKLNATYKIDPNQDISDFAFEKLISFNLGKQVPKDFSIGFRTCTEEQIKYMENDRRDMQGSSHLDDEDDNLNINNSDEE